MTVFLQLCTIGSQWAQLQYALHILEKEYLFYVDHCESLRFAGVVYVTLRIYLSILGMFFLTGTLWSTGRGFRGYRNTSNIISNILSNLAFFLILKRSTKKTQQNKQNPATPNQNQPTEPHTPQGPFSWTLWEYTFIQHFTRIPQILREMNQICI